MPKVKFEIQCFDRPVMYYAGDTYEVDDETVLHFKKIGILDGKRPKAVLEDDNSPPRKQPEASVLQPPTPKLKK